MLSGTPFSVVAIKGVGEGRGVGGGVGVGEPGGGSVRVG